jgi:hypothetical protein
MMTTTTRFCLPIAIKSGNGDDRSALLEWVSAIHVLQEIPNLYSAISVRQQWDIHAYFQPSKDLSNIELRQHRRDVTTHDPSLPQRAGKALAVTDDVYQRALLGVAEAMQTEKNVDRGEGRAA